MMYLYLLIIFCSFLFLISQSQPPPPAQPATPQLYKKFLYKQSFRGPNLAQSDGTIPFWEIVGDAIASNEQLRLAPSMRSKQGAAWNTHAMNDSDFWEIELVFKVSGQGRIGADGLAFWYTADKGALGPVFGSNDYWRGLGLFFDSFDNDAQRNNPYILAMINDGTRAYDHQSDGSSQMLAGCQKDFRNRPFPVKVKIEFLNNVITVLVHDGLVATDRYEICMRVENVFLPQNGYFGLSAATGGLADDHDILGFSVYSYRTIMPQQPAAVPPDDQKKFEEEYQKQQQQFEQEREKFQKEHPDQVKPPGEEDQSKYYEDSTQRELRLIYEGQSAIHNAVQELELKLNQIVQQQDQISRAVAQSPGGAPAPATGVQPTIDTFQRHEVNEALQLARETATTIRELRSYITDGYAKMGNIEQRIISGGSVVGGQQAGGAADEFQFQSVKSYLEGIKHDVEQVRTNQRAQPPPCPVVDNNCLSSMLFFAVIAAQSLVIAVIIIMKSRSEKSKFY